MWSSFFPPLISSVANQSPANGVLPSLWRPFSQSKTCATPGMPLSQDTWGVSTTFKLQLSQGALPNTCCIALLLPQSLWYIFICTSHRKQFVTQHSLLHWTAEANAEHLKIREKNQLRAMTDFSGFISPTLKCNGHLSIATEVILKYVLQYPCENIPLPIP